MSTTFTKDTIKKLRSEIDKALSPLGKKYKIEFNLGNIYFTENQFRGKLTGTSDRKAVVQKKKETDEHSFKVFAKYSGLDPNLLGKVITLGTTQYKIVGWNNRARKSPVKLQRVSDGKGFKASVDFIKYSLKG
jgi:hypothetical protein